MPDVRAMNALGPEVYGAALRLYTYLTRHAPERNWLAEISAWPENRIRQLTPDALRAALMALPPAELDDQAVALGRALDAQLTRYERATLSVTGWRH